MELIVIKRDSEQTSFQKEKIKNAIQKAMLDTFEESNPSNRTMLQADRVCNDVDKKIRDLKVPVINIEQIQDIIEETLMEHSHYKVARNYILYRQNHKLLRVEGDGSSIEINVNDDTIRLYDKDIRSLVEKISSGINGVNQEEIYKAIKLVIYQGMTHKDFYNLITITLTPFIEKDPDYSYLVARLLKQVNLNEVFSVLNMPNNRLYVDLDDEILKELFIRGIKHGVNIGDYPNSFLDLDLVSLSEKLDVKRDDAHTYLSYQTLYDRYFRKSGKKTYETPQTMFMRISMGLASQEKDWLGYAGEFYDILSSFKFMSSTPTLFNSGTTRPQLSSCFLTTLDDDLYEIYGGFRDMAMLSKYAGGIGTDWTNVRALGSFINGTKGNSQGVVPFMKVANDTAVSSNQGGKRRGAFCAYLETWHSDIMDFLDLRKNTGDERRRTHDMNTANWIPDLFMERVLEEENWSLFSPDEVPGLHDLVGKEFKEAYLAAEEKGKNGQLTIFKQIPAIDIWKKMLTMVFETGHPWITFKDPCNIRYTNQHLGVVHSSNLCTEITLHTNKDEIAVCNLGSINLPAHLKDNELDEIEINKTLKTAMRLLDNVIDYNYYSVDKARNSNLQHRPIGLGLLGFQDALYHLGIPYDSIEAVEFSDKVMEIISYFAISHSSDLAKEKGRYKTYKGSLWDQGIFPIDSLRLLEESRSLKMEFNYDSYLGDELWQQLKEKVKSQGMRNSNVLAIAPTATISNICGVSQSIEPTYQNLYVKSNLSGEFIVVNPYLVKDLKSINLWTPSVVRDIKEADGSIQNIEDIPDYIKDLYKTAFELDSHWLIEAGARRQKWIDQSQSLNLYVSTNAASHLKSLYETAWIKGLKTTYYLRTLAATTIEKISDTKSDTVPSSVREEEVKVCSILNPDCEACQ